MGLRLFTLHFRDSDISDEERSEEKVRSYYLYFLALPGLLSNKGQLAEASRIWPTRTEWSLPEEGLKETGAITAIFEQRLNWGSV